MTIYGIFWTRDGISPGDRIEAHEIDWKIDSDYTEVLREFESRDDKYWPSVLFSADITNITLLEEGTCPDYLNAQEKGPSK
ncbi:hypothetical protein DOROTHY_92 [Mycobacterium phage Dorothy]|uniref:Uncharacterized protein n=9 Tax=Cheoctovirus TaxID=1623281 RepID=A0A7G9V032_9CAUD|nr:hypothetical protein BOOMER_94 [Mycobacterium phage Boomer]YP_009016168.1 hypothetical protein CL68_gp090 [Mycobacterium phage Drago]YP_009125370.1 hypothetical protein VC69_gp089 [Mycobacterium phage Inventum]YP_009592067.1 hypothetical protein FDG65_gp092 [Mycobacterium phage Dorothy]YP_009954997.1 hypothetical protein I5H17_gp101 [Mycobacterium phage BodEinwohner17]YP_009958224.1 hypothetical protein I5H48_gp089 [Mycobacterium phage Hlubikazi]YP_009958331.1 hypothetical protein I5H49_gp